MRNLLATCGKILTAEELTNGLKTNQVLFGKSAFEYNLKNVPAYDTDAFPNLECGANFFISSGGDMTWQKLLEVFKDLSNKYETSLLGWKRSGQHKDFEGLNSIVEMERTCVVPFKIFVNTNNLMLYMHEFIKLTPGILDVVIGKYFILYFFELYIFKLLLSLFLF